MIKIRKGMAFYLIVIVTVVLDLNLFFLVNYYGDFRILGLQLAELTFIWNCMIIGYCLVKKGKRFKIKNVDKYWLITLFAFILLWASSVMGTLTYNQPFLYGIASQRLWISCMLMVFPVYYALEKKYITTDGILNAIKGIVIVFLLICIVQYVLGPEHQFTYAITSMRYGDNRFRFDCVYLSFYACFLLDEIFANKAKRIKNISILIGIIFVIGIVSKERMQLMALVAASIICLLIKRGGLKRKMLAVSIVLILIVAFFNSDIGKDILNIFLGTGTQADTMTIRNVSRAYYLKLLSSNPFTALFGYGSASNSWPTAMSISRPTIGSWIYYTSDNGIFGSAFYYGLLGVFWWFVSMIYCLFQAIKVFKKTGKTCYIELVIIDLVAALTLVPYLFKTLSAFSIYLAMLQYDIRRLKEGRIDG